jgi:UBX domain-containing protein 6
VLSRLLSNVVAAPGDPRFRRVRLTNPRIQSAVVDVAGGLELLLACGFEVVFEEAAATADAAGVSSSAAEPQSEG